MGKPSKTPSTNMGVSSTFPGLKIDQTLLHNRHSSSFNQTDPFTHSVLIPTMLSKIILISLALTPFASAHCKITSATGDAGGKGTALGMLAGSGNTESDVTIFNQKTGFGRTPRGGSIDPTTAVPAAMKLAGSSTLPQVSSGGSVNINMHVVNQDGAGPMACYVSADATGQDWQAMQVAQNVPGFSGLSLAADQDYPMVVQMPAGAVCTGDVAGQTGVCMVKCQNPIGPFGGTVAVQMAQGQAAGAGGSAKAAKTARSAGNVVAVRDFLKTM